MLNILDKFSMSVTLTLKKFLFEDVVVIDIVKRIQ